MVIVRLFVLNDSLCLAGHYRTHIDILELKLRRGKELSGRLAAVKQWSAQVV
jgi:hypothetical protein